jgi:hypothetical protein
MPNLPIRIAKKASIFAAKVRSEHLKGFSTRDVINWCTKMMLYKDAVKAAQYTFLPIIDNESVRDGVEDAIKTVFGSRIIIGRYVAPSTGKTASKSAAAATGRTSASVTDPTEILAMVKDRLVGEMSYQAIEVKYGLRPNNGMNSYRVIDKWKKANPEEAEKLTKSKPASKPSATASASPKVEIEEVVAESDAEASMDEDDDDEDTEKA